MNSKLVIIKYKKFSAGVLFSILIIVTLFTNSIVISKTIPKNSDFSIPKDSSSNIDGEMDLDNLIVVYKNGDKKKLKVNNKNINLKNLDSYEKTIIIKSKKDSLDRKMSELEKDTNVNFVQHNYLYKLDTWTRSGSSDTPNDFSMIPSAVTGKNWYYEKENVRKAWQGQDCFNSGLRCGGSPNVVVAIIDTGLAFETRTSAFGDNFVANNDMFGTKSIHLYTNMNEIPNNNIDDDLNGYVDDYHGLNTGITVYCDTYGCSSAKRAEEGHPSDDGGHGTYVTGLIASNVDNFLSSVSPAFNVSIMPLKSSLPYSGSLGTLEIQAAIDYAWQNGADIINMSWGGTIPDKIIKDALSRAYNAGVILVAASGNSGSTSDYPAEYHKGEVVNFGLGNEIIDFDVVNVGAVNGNDMKSSYSNYGPSLDVVAYVGDSNIMGNSVYQRSYLCFYQNPNCYTSKNYSAGFANGFGVGTSFAAPQVTALYSLLLSLKPNLTNIAADMYVFNGARDIGTIGFDTMTGNGVIDFFKSLNNLSNDIAPVLNIIEPSIAKNVDQNTSLTWTDFDFNYNANIDFFWDTNNTGFDGTVINECSSLSEDSLIDNCTFNTSSLLAQTVYIYGCINNSVFAQICHYGSGAITTSHPSGVLRDTGSDIVDGQSKFIKFTTNFTSPPIVISSVSSGLPLDMVYPNIQSITSSGFTVNLEENMRSGYDGNVDPHALNWYAIQNVSANEQIGSVPITDKWKHIQFPIAFVSLPKVLASVETNNGLDIVQTEIKNITTAGFDIRLIEPPGYNGVHTVESVGWVAFINTPNSQNGRTSSTDKWKQINFATSYVTPPIVLFTSNTANGRDQYGFEVKDITNTGFQVRAEEDKSYDLVHTKENLSWVSFHSLINPTTDSGTTTLDNNYKKIPFHKPFSQTPIVIADVNTEHGSDTVDIDIKEVNRYFFVVRLEEDYKGHWDDIHTFEKIAWKAVLPSSNLPEQANLIDITDRWSTINFVNAYLNPPIVLADIQSENGKDTVGLDIKNITNSSFQIRLKEDFKLGWDGVHTTETVGWVAFENPITGESNISNINHLWKHVNFANSFPIVPDINISKRTTNGVDSVLIDIKNLTTTGFDVRLEEEPYFYDHIHTTEQISWYAYSTI